MVDEIAPTIFNQKFTMRLLAIIIPLFIATSAVAQDQMNSDNPLAPFEFLVGGAWTTNTTYQTFEWGLNKQAVHSKLYFIEGDSLIKSGEITWFWHPGEEKIKGYGQSINVEMNFF